QENRPAQPFVWSPVSKIEHDVLSVTGMNAAMRRALRFRCDVKSVSDVRRDPTNFLLFSAKHLSANACRQPDASEVRNNQQAQCGSDGAAGLRIIHAASFLNWPLVQ